MTRLEFKVPWPPTVNNLYATVKGRRVKSAEGRRYAEQVGWKILADHVPRHTLSGPLCLWLYLRPPREHNVGDIANREKALTDALVAAGVIEDDRFIRELHIVREKALAPNGEVDVLLYEIATQAEVAA